MVTTDEMPDISAQAITTRLNGVEVQRAPISDLAFDVRTFIAYRSFFLLVPGDVIVNGITGGVCAYRNPPRWMKGVIFQHEGFLGHYCVRPLKGSLISHCYSLL